MNDHPDMGDQTRAGGPIYRHFSDPSVTTTFYPFTYIGDGSPELFIPTPGPGTIYPASQYPHVEITPATYPCDGPGCDHVATLDERLADWLIVAGAGKGLDHNCNFCSFRCLANWLAEKLAEEETKG